jgi:hypothetical protein
MIRIERNIHVNPMSSVHESQAAMENKRIGGKSSLAE